MALKPCQECDHPISASAKACPQCGAVIRRTSALTWYMAGLITLVLLIALPGLLSEREAARQAPRCPAIQAGALWLPAEKMQAMAAFRAKAEQLNASGQCVLDGSFGTGLDRYYLTVSPTGKARDASHLRFTEAELMR